MNFLEMFNSDFLDFCLLIPTFLLLAYFLYEMSDFKLRLIKRLKKFLYYVEGIKRDFRNNKIKYKLWKKRVKRIINKIKKGSIKSTKIFFAWLGENLKRVKLLIIEVIKIRRKKMENTQVNKIQHDNNQRVNVNKLGKYLDGWGDLIEGMGVEVQRVQESLLQQLQSRKMPDIRVKEYRGYQSIFGGNRDYMIVKTDPGASVAIYISKHGMDLYVSWKTWIKLIFNWDILKTFLVIASVISFLQTYFYIPFLGNFLIVYMPGLGILLPSIGLILIYELIIIIIFGLIFRKHPLGYLLVQPKIFDAEDISAMSLSVHKSLIRALDEVGIDTTKLRSKENFTAGRKGENI